MSTNFITPIVNNKSLSEGAIKNTYLGLLRLFGGIAQTYILLEIRLELTTKAASMLCSTN